MKKSSPKPMALIVITIALISFVGGAAFSSFQLGDSPSSNDRPVATSNMDSRIAALKATVQNDPDNGKAWIELGNAYFDSDQYRASIDAYAKALEFDPLNANIITDMGVMYRRSSQPKKAVEAFDRAIAANPKHETARMNKGIVMLHDLDDTQGAVAAWEGLLGLNPFFMVGGGKSLKEVVDSYK